MYTLCMSSIPFPCPCLPTQKNILQCTTRLCAPLGAKVCSLLSHPAVHKLKMQLLCITSLIHLQIPTLVLSLNTMVLLRSPSNGRLEHNLLRLCPKYETRLRGTKESEKAKRGSNGTEATLYCNVTGLAWHSQTVRRQQAKRGVWVSLNREKVCEEQRGDEGTNVCGEGGEGVCGWDRVGGFLIASCIFFFAPRWGRESIRKGAKGWAKTLPPLLLLTHWSSRDVHHVWFGSWTLVRAKHTAAFSEGPLAFLHLLNLLKLYAMPFAVSMG